MSDAPERTPLDVPDRLWLPQTTDPVFSTPLYRTVATSKVPGWTPYVPEATLVELEQAVKEVAPFLEETIAMHRDIDSPDYNECEKDECFWCESVGKFLRARQGENDEAT